MISSAVLSLALLAPQPPSPCATTDLMPAFWKFWDAARGRPVAEQATLFQERVMKANAAVYEGAFHGVPTAVPQLLADSFEKVPELEPRMRELSGRLSTELPRQIARFRDAFPRFRCGTAVYFLYSAGAFDGATRDVSGEESLMFGIDVIARLDEQLSPLVIHELFHVYHAERVPRAPEAFYWQMWEEGLASYVSRRLNPDVPESRICCLPEAGPIDAVRSKVASGALERLDSDKPEDYRRYFLGGKEEIDIPHRSGYLLGYRIAAEAGRTRSLEDLAQLQPAEVRRLIESGLRGMQAENISDH
jgi:hypothetical protein